MAQERYSTKTPAERLIQVIENPSKSLEKNLDRIERQMGAFQASAEADIAKLLQFDHSEPKNAVTDRAYRESLNSIHQNRDVSHTLITMLSDVPQEERVASTIASLETLLQAVDDSLKGHDYRKQNSLRSAEKQVEDYITVLAGLKGDETISPEDVERLTHQPDIIEMYNLGVQELEAAKKILGPKYSVVEVLQYTDELIDHDPMTWTQEGCDNATAVVQALEKLKDLALFKSQTEERLLELSKRVQTRVETTSGLDQVLTLIDQARELQNDSSSEIDQLASLLDEVLFLDNGENNGWADVDEAAAKEALALAKTAKQKFSGQWRLFKSKDEKALLDKQVAFCTTAEDFLTKLLKSKDQRERLKPVIIELKLTASYIQAQRDGQAQREAEEEAEAA